MRCFAISDLHLSFTSNKPMDRFGNHWLQHWEKVASSWQQTITSEDLVLLPGDHSWALKLDQAVTDLEFIQNLPGHKVMVRGNHDYWWQSLSKVRQRFPGLHFLQSDALQIGSVALCGTRGWDLPEGNTFTDSQDEKIYRREIERLKLALKAISPTANVRIALLHYPPLYPYRRQSEFTRLLELFKIDICVFGHLHRNRGHKPFKCLQNGVAYYLVSCDMLDFQPVEIPWPEHAPR